jgi:hypothetical protein
MRLWSASPSMSRSTTARGDLGIPPRRPGRMKPWGVSLWKIRGRGANHLLDRTSWWVMPLPGPHEVRAVMPPASRRLVCWSGSGPGRRVRRTHRSGGPAPLWHHLPLTSRTGLTAGLETEVNNYVRVAA